MDVARLGETIKALREQKGYSQRHLAMKAELSNTAISALERGGREGVSMQTVAAIAKGLNISLPELLRAAGEAVDDAANMTISASHVKLPVLGSVPTDQPLLTEEDAVEYILFPIELSDEAEFALEVCDASMAEAGIDSGDYVFVSRKITAASGDIVVCRLGNETAIKRYYQADNTILLHTASVRSNPITVNPTDDFALTGVVVGSYRRFR